MVQRLPKKDYEVFRKRAVALYESKKLNQTEIAGLLGVGQSAVSRWVARSKSGETDWHLHKIRPGAKPKLSDEQFQSALTELEKGAVSHGFEGEYWTAARASVVIDRLFGVKYDADHLGRKLGQAKWSFKNPILKARQQSPVKIAQWKEERLPELKKS